MRLIDVDALIEAMKKTESEYESAMTCPSWWSAFNVISEQSTAYDIDKVVEELQENASRYTKKYVTPYGNNGYKDTKAISIHKAIEIVKQGGVSDDISREAKQGKWILDEFTAKYGNPYRCSCCNIEFGDTYNYCPNCGAGMKKVVE